ncbi:ABC transporter substrate-binding protein [Gemmatimonadota bacterium]
MIHTLAKHKIIAGILPAFALMVLMLPGTVELAPNSAITVVKSSDLAQYKLVSNIISERLGGRQEAVTTEQLQSGSPEEEERFWRDISESSPQLVVTVGTRATRSALQHCGKLPIVFTMVLDQLDSGQKSGGDPDFGGVTLSIPVDAQFESLKKILPDARRLGYIYASGSEADLEQARKAADKYGMQLVAEKVVTERDILDALGRMLPEIDAFWMPFDNLTMQDLVFRYMVVECFRNDVPVISVYRFRAEAGIPIALGLDYEDIGRQTADLVIKRLDNGKFTRPVIDNPRKLVIYINRGVLSNLNLKIPDDLLDQTVSVKNGS